MAVTKERVESTLKSTLNPSHLILIDSSFLILAYHPIQDVIDQSGGCGASFSIEIVSEQFVGKRLLDRHRMVNAALAEEMKQIHALSITKALAPEQWKQQQEAQKSQADA